MDKDKKKIEKEADKIQDRIEEKTFRERQREYKLKIPAFIWILKVLAVITIIEGVTSVFLFMTNITYLIQSILMIALAGIFFYGLTKRKRWALYLGLASYLINIISFVIRYFLDKEANVIYLVFGVPVYLFFALVLYWHKDYLNQ